MKIASIVLGILLALALIGGGLFYAMIHKPLSQEAQQIRMKNLELERKLGDVEHELNAKVAEISKAQTEKEEEIARVQSTKDSLITAMQKEIDNNQIQITQMADKLKMSIVDKILFPSGEADISPEGIEVLTRVGNLLKSMKDKIIRVEGHTDNVPIHARLQSKYPTNWDLSTARANNVVRFLVDKIKLNGSRIEAVGLGEYRPVASNDTKEGRAKNRRIEIALLPIK